MTMKSLVICVLLLFFAFFHFTTGGNVLFVSMCNSPSHRRSMLPLAENLAQRGHTVTIFAENPEDDNAKGKHVMNKLIVVPYKYGSYSQTLNNILWNQEYFSPLMMWLPWDMCGSMTDEMLQVRHDAFDQILNQHWDLILVDILFTPTGMLFAAMKKAPYVLYGTTVFSTPECLSRSIPSIPSTFPAMFLTSHHYDHVKFMDRLSTAWSELQYVFITYMIDKFVLKPRFKLLVPDISIHDFYNGADAVVLDYPTDLDYPRPLTRDMIHVAGKCKDHTLYEKQLLEFVEDPMSKGTVVIAFGHQVKWEASPEHIKINFAKALNMLKDYRIFWQFPGDPPIKMESHVKTMSWLPQTEILNHPKTKVFVSHGGLKSIMEAVCAHVPMVLIPFFAEQIRNGLLMERGNSSIMLDKFHLNPRDIVDSILEVATNDTYHKFIKKLKWSVVEKPVSPSENGIFWSEFMLRHNGLPKAWFQLKGSHMSWFTYFCCDVLLVLLALSFSSLFVMIKVLKFFVTNLRRTPKV